MGFTMFTTLVPSKSHLGDCLEVCELQNMPVTTKPEIFTYTSETTMHREGYT